MANKRVLSIEIGSRLTRIAEVDYKIKNPRVYRRAMMVTPDGIMNDGNLKVTPEFVKQLKTKISQSGMKSKQVIFSVTSTKIASREILIPKVKENRIAALVAANASDYFPVDLSEYELAYLLLDTVRETVDTQKYKVMVLAMAKSMLEGYERLAAECGLNIVAVDYSGNSVFQMVKKECPEGMVMVVRVNENSSLVTILENGVMLMQRTVSYGVDGIVNCYREEQKEEISYEQALKVLEENNYLKIPEEGEENQAGKEQFERYVYAFSDAGLGISRIYDYHNSRNIQKTISKVYLTGLGADILGLNDLLAQRLDIQVENLEAKGEYQLDEKKKREHSHMYISCMGAALAPLGFMDGRKEIQKSSEKKLLGSKLFLFFVSCAAVSVVLLLMGAIPYFFQQSRKIKNEEKIEELHEVIPVYQEYVQTKNADNYLEAAYEVTMLPTENLVDFMEEMEEKMPKDMYVNQFSANREGVAFQVTVGTKQQAADALLQLRSFESITNLKVDSITDTRQENNSGTVTFMVRADYVNGKPMDKSEDLDAADEILREYEELETEE